MPSLLSRNENFKIAIAVKTYAKADVKVSAPVQFS